MAYEIYANGQITKFEAGVIYRAYKEGTIKCLPEFPKFMYDCTDEYIKYASVRYRSNSTFYDRIYDLVDNILNSNFDKANELIEVMQNDWIENHGKKSIWYKYKGGLN